MVTDKAEEYCCVVEPHSRTTPMAPSQCCAGASPQHKRPVSPRRKLQVYFMSCTPSDVRYIWAVRAGLARLDRAAAQKRQELAAAAAAGA